MITFEKLKLVKEMIIQLKMIAIYLRKQQALDADPKAIQQINFTGKLARDGDVNTTFFIIEEAKETV